MKIKCNYSKEISRTTLNQENRCFLATKTISGEDFNGFLNQNNILLPKRISNDIILNILVIIIKTPSDYVLVLEDEENQIFEKFTIPLDCKLLEENKSGNSITINL